MLKFIAHISLQFFVLSCVQQGGTIPNSIEFKKTMSIEVNGLKGVGVLVVPKAEKYKIKIKINSRAELIKLNSCHRELTVEKSGWRDRKRHTFEFFAASGIENEGFCPLMIGSFDKQGGHEWAMIEVRNRELKAGLHCNGESEVVHGVSICQARIGLQQRINFTDMVNFNSVDNCGGVLTDDKKQFDFYPEPGICVISFYSSARGKFHRLTVYGFNDIMIGSIKNKNQFPTDAL